MAKKSRNYPNPGYLGSSSHITIFGHLAPNSNDAPNDSIAADPGEDWVNDGQVSHGAKLIETFQRSYPVSSCIQLVEAWMTKGVNFALAGDFTESCIRSMGTVFQKLTQGKSTALDTAKNLFGHSCRPLIFDASTTLEQFVENFSLDKTRWETLGLFFAAAALASIDIICFEPLFSSEEQRRRFQKLNMNFTDRCLEACLSLDCLNDLQLVLQYENWVVHSFIDGDQSELRCTGWLAKLTL